ncbi:MAG: tRNA glutamyl-Q(34) synthetase GluQRS [Lysobacteraceae bacterium]
MSTPRYRGRFAPTPSGPLHFGSLVAALGSWLDARHHGGQWLLRIEDIDPPRERPGAARAQLQALAAFGLQADEPVRFQRHRHAAYDAALDRLRQRDMLFPCRCSRSDLAATHGIHRACVARPSAPHPAWRLRIADGEIAFRDRRLGDIREDTGRTVGDVVLRRSDGLYAYQLAVVVDDAAQGITDVVRGADLLDSTARQIAVQRALGLPTPRYLHLPLALGPDGEKLSKSLAACPVDVDQPVATLSAAWRFLLPDLPVPVENALPAWLDRAAERYRPQALRTADAVPAAAD